jgi:N6-adenosine-specific RNA methylase IME4
MTATTTSPTIDGTASNGNGKALAPIIKAQRMLAEATTLEQILRVENLAQRARDFAKAAGLSRQAQNTAAKLCLDARRKAGTALKEMRDRGQLAEHGVNRHTKTLHAEMSTLGDLDINPLRAHRYLAEASVPEKDYQQWATRIMDEESDFDLTAAGLRKLAKRETAAETHDPPDRSSAALFSTLPEIILTGQKFVCVYGDPPWRYGNQATRAATDDHYPTMTVEQICREPIAELAAEKAALFLWTTTSFLRESLAVIDAWGFTYKTNMVWVKRQIGIGNYVRVSHEHLMIATRGGLRTAGRNQRSTVDTAIEADRTAHSAKPDCFRAIVENLCPGPYLELYGREQVPGWTVYGNQINAQTRFA